MFEVMSVNGVDYKIIGKRERRILLFSRKRQL